MSWRRGYRTGGLSLDPVTIPAGNNPFKPETVDSYELGYKGQYGLGGDAELRLNLAAYYSDYKNIQKSNNLTVSFPDGTSALQTLTLNAAKGRIWGVEVEPSLGITRNLQFTGSYAYTNAKYDEYIGLGANNTPIDLSAFPFGNVPKHKVTGSLQWSLPIAEGTLTLTPSAVYQSAQEIEETPGFGAHQPGYTTVNFRADYDFSNGLNIAAFVNNLTAKKYYIDANQLYDVLGFTVAYPGEPRMYGLELSAKF